MRLAAANRGIWKASQLQRLLAEHGLVISAGKMSNLWSGQPVSLKLDDLDLDLDLDVVCVVLDCQIGELLIPEPGHVTRPATDSAQHGATARAPGSPAAQPPIARIVPRRRDGRSLPPA
jgi:DNA-binding Xre family transcriptional regulator